MTRQNTHHGFTLAPQFSYGFRGPKIFAPRRPNGRLERTHRRDLSHLFQIKTEACGRSITPKNGTHLVITPATHKRVAHSFCVNSKTGTAVVGISTQIRQIKSNAHTIKAL
ncbi:hypothetical protein EV674_102186 [Simplicispira metamorpha]|uniref:Uncharacterized protein n=1 Tax=Simplicispira metamorpha TaxID=80881 RepID=A0A4R2NG80_9BURK|nr:hypothetical protein EV674_102186 [Simplicispira metamorpha]